jgi:hypothetical protein
MREAPLSVNHIGITVPEIFAVASPHARPRLQPGKLLPARSLAGFLGFS